MWFRYKVGACQSNIADNLRLFIIASPQTAVDDDDNVVGDAGNPLSTSFFIYVSKYNLQRYNDWLTLISGCRKLSVELVEFKLVKSV